MALLVTRTRTRRHFLDFLRGQNQFVGSLYLSSVAEADRVSSSSSAFYRTPETDSRKLTVEHVGKLFTVDPKIVAAFGEEMNTRQNLKAINYFAPRDWTKRNEVFRETSLIVRKPAVDIVHCIQNSDLSKPAVRFVLYGRDGAGKTLTLSHLICYGHQDNYIVMPFAWLRKWVSQHYEVAPSSYRPGRIDHVMNANIYLKNFKLANAARLSKCVTHKEYTWSARDKVQAGAPLMEVLDLGCDRLTFAADAMNVLIRELKLNCSAGNCKLMVVLDGVNALFSDYTQVHKERRLWDPRTYKTRQDWRKHMATVDECSVLRSIKKLLVADYPNAVVVTTVDRLAKMTLVNREEQERNMVPDTTSHLPFALLGDSGWSVMNPFIPVEVNNYTEAEMDSTIDYHVDMGWLRKEAGREPTRKEIHFLTGRNPGDFFKFSNFF